MAFASNTTRTSSVSALKAPGLAATLVGMVRDMTRDLSGSYRPERHYMRGPGPKWREKHVVFAAQPAGFPRGLQTA